MPQHVPHGPVKRVLNTEYSTGSDSTGLKRTVRPDGTRTEWQPVTDSPQLQPEEPPQLLMLVRQKQADGEPFHWSLFVAAEGQPGSVYQVKGDATFMHHVFEENTQLIASTSYHSSYILAQLRDGEDAIVKRYAEKEEPPRAANRREVKENCQGWTIRVLKHLREAGIVEGRWVTFAEGMKEPV